MADLNRPDYGQVWASTGEKVAPDTVKMQSGWVQEMMPFQYENYLQARQDEAIVYLLQKGVPEYSSAQEYIANKSVVAYQGNLYMATATVTNVLPTVTASWKRLNPSLAANGAVPVSSGGTGATTASEARTNLGLGSIATSTAPATNGVVVKDANDSLVARTITGTSGNITITNPDGVSGNINVNVGSNVAQLSQDSSWTSNGGIRLPSGSTGERGTEVAGKIRYNTTLQKFEGFDGTSWNALGASSNIEITTLSGNGVTTNFTLNSDVFSAVATDVYIGGIYQNKGSYSVSGSTITFSEAPVAGVDNIQVLSRRVVDLGLSTATQVSIQDTTNLYTSSTVEGALREVGDKTKYVKNAILSFPNYAAASAAAATLPEGSSIVVEGVSQGHVVAGAYVADSGTSAVCLQDYAALRAYQGKSTAVDVTAYGLSGRFLHEPLSTAADNGGTILVGADNRRWHRVFTGRASVKWFGAKGDGSNDTVAMQLAFNSGVPLYAPKGVYGMDLSQTIVLEGGITYCSLKMPSGLNIVGDGMGKTIFKMLDNQSTDASPKYANMWAANTVLSDVLIQDITFDLNGQNNKISPDRGSGVYNTFNFAAIFVSGRVATVGTDARMVNSKILRCEFLNTPGVTCIATGQQEGVATPSRDVEIAGCRFYNNGLDTHDHSSVYMWGDSISVHDCIFDHPTVSTGIAGPVVAAELHGSDSSFTNNVVRNYCQGVWVCGSANGAVTGNVVSDNIMHVSWTAVGLWSIGALSLGISGVTIADNVIVVLDGPILNPGMSFPKTGMLLSVNKGVVTNIVVDGNAISCQAASANYGIVLAAGPTADAAIFGANISHNIFSGFSQGILLGGSGATQYDVMIANNTFANITALSSVPITYGIKVLGANGTVSITGNMFRAVGASSIAYGVWLASGATFDNLNASGNHTGGGVSGAVFSDSSVVYQRRTGEQALTFSALPAQSSWLTGDVAYLANRPVLGTSPNKYVVDGWTRITSGTGNVFNTDWVERRLLTGT